MPTSTAAARSRAEALQRLADSALIYALGCVFVVALLLGVVNGWARGATLAYKIGWAVFAVAVVCVEFGAIKKAVSAYSRGDYPMTALSLCVGILGFVISSFATFNSAASNIDMANADRTAKSNVYEDGRAGLKRAESTAAAELKNLEGLRLTLASTLPRVGDQTLSSVAQAEQLVAKAKNDRWWSSTSGCTETKGPNTSKFCAEYRQAEAAIEALRKREKLESDVASAEGRYAAAQSAVGVASAAAGRAIPQVDKTSPFVRLLVRKFEMEREDAELVEAGLPSVILQAFLMLLGLISAGSPQRLDEVGGHVSAPSLMGGSLHPRHISESPQGFNVNVQHFDPFGMAMSKLHSVQQAPPSGPLRRVS